MNSTKIAALCSNFIPAKIIACRRFGGSDGGPSEKKKQKLLLLNPLKGEWLVDLTILWQLYMLQNFVTDV